MFKYMCVGIYRMSIVIHHYFQCDITKNDNPLIQGGKYTKSYLSSLKL